MTTLFDLMPGERVAMLAPGSTAYVEVVIGLLDAGVVPVPLDPGLTARERQVVLAHVRPAAVVDDPAELRRLAAAVTITDATLPRARPMHLTSGTTGSPKGVWSGLLDPGVRSGQPVLVGEDDDLDAVT